ncbi:CTR2 protein, partial [Pseudoatta argentina]
MTMNLTLYLVIILILDVNYGIQALRIRRLIGGQPAIESEFPYQVSVRYYNLHICSGALISDRHVLSAAHCICGLIDEPSEELSVHTGSINLKEGEKHAVKDVICHPDYVYGSEKSWTADLVVIMLAKEICISSSQSPIALAMHDDVPIGQQAIISGWGRVHPFSWLSRDLQKLSVPIIDNNVCQTYYKNTTILNSQICTFERKGIGACKVKYIIFYENILLLLHFETYAKLNWEPLQEKILCKILYKFQIIINYYLKLFILYI